jgi:SAM-dependent methyltransferase
MKFPDIADWYTPERIDAEEPLWATGKSYLEYASRIHSVCRDNNLSSVVEIGCGTGWVPTVLDSSLQYLGIDKNPYMLERCRAKNTGKLFLQCDIRNLHALNLSCDLVCSFAVLKHFSPQEWVACLNEVLGLGRFALFTLSIFTDGRETLDIPAKDEHGIEQHHGTWATLEEAERAIESAGHRIVDADYQHRFDRGIGAPEVMFTTRQEII